MILAKLGIEMAVVGYARVSTQDQHLTGQLEALKAAGAEVVYREKVSGTRADRQQLAKLMAKLGPDDVVIVTKLDRLGRSTRELLELIERIGRAGAVFRSLGDPLWDTSSSQGRLLSTLLAAIAEFLPDLIVKARSPICLAGAVVACVVRPAHSRIPLWFDWRAPARPCGLSRHPPQKRRDTVVRLGSGLGWRGLGRRRIRCPSRAAVGDTLADGGVAHIEPGGACDPAVFHIVGECFLVLSRKPVPRLPVHRQPMFGQWAQFVFLRQLGAVAAVDEYLW
jgi:hypothetical protein